MIAQPVESQTRHLHADAPAAEPIVVQHRPSPAPASEALFRQLVLDHRQRLSRFIVKHFGWGTDAEDLTQQAFVEAAQSYASFKGASELSTWLYRDDTTGRVAVEADIDAQAFTVTLADQAPAFNPMLVPEPDISLSIEERQIGGLGLLFVRRTADSLAYERVAGADGVPTNRVTFSKRLPA